MSIITKNREKAVTNLPRELGKVLEVPINSIIPNPNQPRQEFDPIELTKLAKSISQDGIIQPLTIKQCESGFELVTGERRLRAAKLAGLKNVPCVLVDISDKRSAVIALIENIQRADLNFFEEAFAISALIKKYGMTQEETAIRLGIAQSTVANKLRLLKLTDEERQIIVLNHLTERHSRALLKISDEEMRKEVLLKIVQESMTVETSERYINSIVATESVKKSYQRRSVVLKDVKLFFNTVDKAVKVMKMAGVDAKVQKSKQDGFIEYTIRIKDNECEQVEVI